MKRLLFFSSEPGGAEVLIPAIHLVKKQGYDLHVMAYGYAVERFRKGGVQISEMCNNEWNSVSSSLRDLHPHYIITSAASLPWKDMTEKYLWDEARQAGIGSIAFIDQWQNYSERFSGTHPGDRLKFLPDHINCINETGRQEMIEEGFPENRLIMLGHPYLDHITKKYTMLNAEEVISKLGMMLSDFHSKETMVFVSEPLYENYGNSRGYSQYDVLSYFLKYVLKYRPRSRVVIKLHPKDELKKFQGILKHFMDIEILVVKDELTSIECLTLSDRIFGMTSLMLIEAFLLGKTVVSLQPDLTVTDPLVLSRHGLISKINGFIDFDPFEFDITQPSGFSVDFDKSGFLTFLASRL